MMKQAFFSSQSPPGRPIPRQATRAPARVTLLLVLLAALALTLPPSPALAEKGVSDGPAPEDLTTLTIEQLMEIEVDTVSGASRYDQPVTEAPASVSIVTADEIKKFGYRNLADILQSVPGFSITNDRNYQYAGIRGFGLPGDYGTRMLLLVDGVRQSDPVYQTAFIGSEMVVDVDLIERVEVIRGPGHTLYGANAMLGVINVITKRGRDLDGFEVSGQAGSFDTYQGRLSYGKKFTTGPEMLLSGTFLHNRGQDLYYPEFDSPSTDFGWARGCDRERFGSAFLKMIYHGLTLEGGYVQRDKTLPTAPWGTVFNNPGTEAGDSSLFLDLKYRHTFESGLDMTSRLSWNQYRYDGRYIYDSSEEGDAQLLFTNIDKARSSWLQGEVQLSGEVAEKHRLVGGLEFRTVLRMVQLNYDTEMYLDDRRTSWNAGLYLQDEYRILDTLILTAGLRYDHFDTFGDTVNPRVALIYSPLSRTTAKFLFGTAFRPPSGYELYYGDGYSQKTNPGLREERSINYELTIDQYLGRHFRGSVSGFYSRVKDLISQVLDPSDDLLVFRNIDKADLKGVELELDGKWDNGMQGKVSYTFQDGRNLTTDERLPNSARHLVKLNLVLPVLREKVFLGMEEQYTSRKRTLGRNETRDFFITNLTLFTRNLLKNFELSGSVYNLFNTGYSIPAGGEFTQDTLRQDGRTFRVKATWKF